MVQDIGLLRQTIIFVPIAFMELGVGHHHTNAAAPMATALMARGASNMTRLRAKPSLMRYRKNVQRNGMLRNG